MFIDTATMKRWIAFCLLISLAVVTAAQQLSVTNLRCEYRQNPAGVDAPAPKLSWELQSRQQNVLQIAYRVLVADDSVLFQRNAHGLEDGVCDRRRNGAMEFQRSLFGLRGGLGCLIL